ncbi:ATP-binding cassette sub-family G member 8 [Cyclospora cayetanensis]|uniref:ATP-binding cassette sub-family G member 8 n=1 Tax=Cyclospora cayetanensis TaxID=88456 RepID=A0A6P6RSJ0_9EIME|nr:ATP-binding cassette sub-family G member 8 [Cyclospora cayetanensis]
MRLGLWNDSSKAAGEVGGEPQSEASRIRAATPSTSLHTASLLTRESTRRAKVAPEGLTGGSPATGSEASCFNGGSQCCRYLRHLQHAIFCQSGGSAATRGVQGFCMQFAYCWIALCSGVIKPGSVVALMGPSGSGKTTLLDCLSGKKAKHDGDVFLNGVPRVYRDLKRVAIYVPQDAIYTGQETVQEVLEFSAALKTNYTKEERHQLVDGAIEFLGLSKVAHKRVGNIRVRGISGGQKKRLMAGQALVSLAQLCFCDEPTSGLSSTDASSLVLGLRRVASQCGVTFIVSIHQPRSEVFECFDSVILLAAGRCIYNGPREYMEAYFTRLEHPLPLYLNPAEFYLELVTVGYEAFFCGYSPKAAFAGEGLCVNSASVDVAEPPHSQKAQWWTGKSKEEGEAKDRIGAKGGCERETQAFTPPGPTKVTEGCSKETLNESAKDVGSTEAEEEGPGSALNMLLRDGGSRSFLAETVLGVAAALNSPHGAGPPLPVSDSAVFYQLSAHVLMCIALSIIPFVNTVIYLERKLQLLYETSDGYYSPGPYLLAEICTSFLLILVTLVPSLLIIFGLCGFPFGRLPMVLLLYFIFEAVSTQSHRVFRLLSFAAVDGEAAIRVADEDLAAVGIFVDSIMQLCSALLSTFMGVNAVGGGWLFLTSLLNGLNANPKSVPTALRFLIFLSPYFYLFEGLAIVLYNDDQDIFNDPERRAIFGYPTIEEMYKAFGLAGTFADSSLTPKQWLWLADILPLAGSTVAAHGACILYWMNKRLAK